MGMQLSGLKKLRGKVKEAEATVQRTGAIAENRTYLLGEVQQLSQALPAVIEALPEELEAAFRLGPAAGAPAAGGAPAAAGAALAPAAVPLAPQEQALIG